MGDRRRQAPGPGQGARPDRAGDRPGLWPAPILLCFLSLLISGGAHAQQLPPPIALGSECGLITSCPWSGPLAAHISIGGDFYIEDDAHGQMQPLLWGGLDFSGWRWFEGGIRFGVRLNAGERFADQHPLTAWGRLSPQLGREHGVAVALELQADTMLVESGTFYGDAQHYTLSAGYQAPIVRIYGTGSYIEAGHRTYRTLQAGGGLSVGIQRIGLALLAEAVGRVPVDSTPASVTYALGIRIFDKFGVGFKAGYSGARDALGQAGMPPHAALGHFRFSYGPGYLRDHPDPPQRPDVLMLWFLEHLYGWHDPIVGRDGFIYDDDGKTRRYRFGTPHPYQPGYVLPFRGPGPVRAGSNVIVHDDGSVRALEGGDWLGYAGRLDVPGAVERTMAKKAEDLAEQELRERARTCEYCRPSPMPMLGDGAAGYMVGCALVRWKGCGLKPWNDPGTPAADPGMWGAVSAGGVRAAAAGGRAVARPPTMGQSQPVTPGTRHPPSVVKRAQLVAKTDEEGHRLCENCGLPMTPRRQVQKGEQDPRREVANHTLPRSKGYDGTDSNIELWCDECNAATSDKYAPPWTKNPVDPRMPFSPSPPRSK